MRRVQSGEFICDAGHYVFYDEICPYCGATPEEECRGSDAEEVEE